MMPNTSDYFIDVRVHHRLTARDRNDGRTEFSELIDALKHYVDRHRVAGLVVFVAVCTRKIAATHWYDVNKYRMFGRCERADGMLNAAGKSAEATRLGHK